MRQTDANVQVTRAEISEHLEAVVGSPAFGGASSKYADLLRYLVDSSLAEETRHEIDIAIDVFGKDQTYDPAESSSVRVRVHQLRKKLDDYYKQAASDDSRVRFSIPKGSYRIAFGADWMAREAGSAGRNGSGRRILTFSLAAVSLLLLVSFGVNMLLMARLGRLTPPLPAAAPPIAAFPWDAVAEGPEPILIALGDFFVFREDTAEGRTRFIRDIEVNSLEDLRELAADGTWIQPADLTYLPKSTAFTLETILPIVQATGKPVSLKLMSQVTGEDLREHDVIYVGFIRSMGPLQEYFFRSSTFSSPRPFVELHDKQTGETFVSSVDPYGHTHDYGLFAKLAGPGDGEILMFTGIRDIGILHVVRALTEQDRVEELARQVAANLEHLPSSIEILFEVSGFDRTDLQATLIKAGRPAAAEELADL